MATEGEFLVSLGSGQPQRISMNQSQKHRHRRSEFLVHVKMGVYVIFDPYSSEIFALKKKHTCFA